MKRDEETNTPQPSAPAPGAAQPEPAADKKTDRDHQGHRNEIDQAEGNMHNGELGGGLQQTNA